MVSFKTEIERFEKMGEKTGWTFVRIPSAVASEIKPDCRKSFRIKGRLDQVEIAGLALVPMGEGDYILALKASLRKALKKQEGAILELVIEEDKDYKIELSDELRICLEEEPRLLKNFLAPPLSHQHYFINWVNGAKTEHTRTKRLVHVVNAMDVKMDFPQMIRSAKG